MNLFHQLCKTANIYFIIICILQMIKPISISGGLPTNAPPLLFVIFVCMVKDFVEDRVRQKSDSQENNSITHILGVDGSWREIMWRDVKIGDVLKVQENEAIPADLIILKTEKDNICYVETKNLDGETNLKHKAAPLETVELAESLYKNITIESELPSDKIYSF